MYAKKARNSDATTLVSSIAEPHWHRANRIQSLPHSIEQIQLQAVLSFVKGKKGKHEILQECRGSQSSGLHLVMSML
ncbi:hypothetical protein LshimejAT787_0408760 [Lyophyllum shimeji]|uniref:Uncharacterized protein n=1 Tax=Lyophyllum shimeji TaxID=47721 RepID=A0A9P3UNG5_LYOSH|nr:hypothetical protein LshimejAT787_0408760 [Lyophyllum shimeji]